MIKQRFTIEGMTCSSCQAHVQKAVESVEGVTKVNVNLLTGEMEVEYNIDSTKNDISVIEAVKKAGYHAIIFKEAVNNEQSIKDDHSKKRNLVLSIILSIVLMAFSMLHMITLDYALLSSIMQFILAFTIIIINRSYFVNGFKHLVRLNPNMDSLIAIGSTASVLFSIYEFIMIISGIVSNNTSMIKEYYTNLYFDSAGMILTLVSFGKYLEYLSKRKTTNALSRLMKLTPKETTIKVPQGTKTIPTSEVKQDDIVILKSGAVVPIDGVIISGNASLDQSSITGESLPVYKKCGDNVISSSIIIQGYLEVKAIKVGENTTIKTIIKLVNEAANSKAPISRLVDKVARVFVPVVMLISLIAFIVFLITYDFQLALRVGISVLVISCPCALGLATPVAIMVGTGKAAELGILIKNAEVLEKASEISVVVFDKTGTITTGNPEVTDVLEYNNHLTDYNLIDYNLLDYNLIDYNLLDYNLLDIALSLENKSSHPLSKAITKYAHNNKLLDVKDFENHNGEGLSGVINNKKYYIGSYEYVKKLNATNYHYEDYQRLCNDGKMAVYVLRENEVMGIIAVFDMIRESSYIAMSELKKKGINVILLSGDSKLTAAKIAEELHMDKAFGEVLPIEKQRVIKELKEEMIHSNKDKLAMVGDGINDALALTTSDIGISLESGTDIAMDSSDIVLMHNNIADVPKCIYLSKRIMTKIKGNLFWAFFYNSLGILLASGVLYPVYGILLNPMISALAMSFSSVFVVLNSLSINLFKLSNEKKGQKKMNNYRFTVSDMACIKCQNRIEKALKETKGINDVAIDLTGKTVVVTADDKMTSKKIIAILKKAGYTGEEI